jgi:outer membrane protein assembly factor BamB
VLWIVLAFFGATFAAYLSWLHATQEVVVLAHDSRIPAVLFGLLALSLVALAIHIARSRAQPRRWLRAVLVIWAGLWLVVLPGRIMLIRGNYANFGSIGERDARNALRLLISSQEQSRIVSGSYTDSVTRLDSVFMRHAPSGASFLISAVHPIAWSGSVTVEGVSCRVAVRHGAEFDARLIQRHRNFLDDDITCRLATDAGSEPNLTPTQLHRPTGNSHSMTAANASGMQWSQERGSPDRRGIASDALGGVSWTVRVGGSVRAVATPAYPFVIVGTHGTGWLGALDANTGATVWSTRAPNWIHQNPLVARQTVVVGVGDRARMLAGDAVGLGIGGVAAYDLSTGSVRWFARTAGAVMTAPVIAGDAVVSADGAGNLESRDLGSGRLLWRTLMPGQSVMASPAIRGSTVYVALEHRIVCAYVAHNGQKKWCYRAPRDFRIGGDATPSVVGGAVYWSLSQDSTGLEMLLRGKSGRNYLKEKLTGRARDHSSQWIFALDAATGSLRWRRELGGGYSSRGNMAGTAIPFRNAVVVVVPRAHRLVAIDTASGEELWGRALDAFSRGAVTVVDSSVILTDADQHLHIFDARNGAEACRGAVPDVSDRSGPTILGRTAIFTGLNGFVFARPLERVLRCAVQ